MQMLYANSRGPSFRAEIDDVEDGFSTDKTASDLLNGPAAEPLCTSHKGQFITQAVL